jgi:ribosomal 50S subunit-associated protein YjgA (DUF615 family)
LKNRQTEQNGKMMREDEITNLQSSIAWFKQEAVKLNEILDGQKTETVRKKFL